MKIVAGLGNPGPKYETTRHNAGFLLIDRLIDDWKATPLPDQFSAEIHQATVAGEKTLLIKPQTFMNLSGESVGPLLRFFKCAPEDLIVIHDELDLKPLVLRLKTGGGAGGHNGIKSIDQVLGGKNGYHRVRIGIGHPRGLVDPSAQATHARDVTDYVLQQFTDDELSKLNAVFDDARTAVELLIQGEALRAMNQFNQKG